jgi:hypothetical protein
MTSTPQMTSGQELFSLNKSYIIHCNFITQGLLSFYKVNDSDHPSPDDQWSGGHDTI